MRYDYFLEAFVLKQMTISVEEDVYNILAPFAEKQTLGDYISQFVRPRSIPEVTKTEKTSDMFDAAARLNGYKDHRDYLRANSPKTIAEAKAEAERKFNDRKGQSFFDRFYGILEGDEIYGDGTEYQRKMRSEWPD